MGRWTNWSEGEQAFFEDVRQKKQAANGVHSKKGKRGYVGVMRMPNEIMSRKDKYNYRRNGKVRTYRMLVTFEEFKELDKSKRKEFLEEYLKDHSKTELKNAWNGADIYYYLQQAGLHTPERGTGERITHKKRTALLLEQERQQIGAAREKMEEDILTAFTAAEEAKKEIESIRNELNITKQYFKQTFDEMSNFHKTAMQTAHLMLEEQQKEIAALRSNLESTQAALKEEVESVEFLTDELGKVKLENETRYNRLELNMEQAKGLTSITAAPTISNDLQGKIKGLEIDVTLLKQLAIR